MKKLIAVVVAMMLALAFTACAQEMKKDEMPKDDMMKAEETEKDSMEKDAMAEEAMEKKDEMMGEACMCGDSSKCMMDGACKEKDGCMCMKDGISINASTTLSITINSFFICLIFLFHYIPYKLGAPQRARGLYPPPFSLLFFLLHSNIFLSFTARPYPCPA